MYPYHILYWQWKSCMKDTPVRAFEAMGIKVTTFFFDRGLAEYYRSLGYPAKYLPLAGDVQGFQWQSKDSYAWIGVYSCAWGNRTGTDSGNDAAPCSLDSLKLQRVFFYAILFWETYKSGFNKEIIMNCPYCNALMEKGLIESSEPINFMKEVRFVNRAKEKRGIQSCKASARRPCVC